MRSRRLQITKIYALIVVTLFLTTGHLFYYNTKSQIPNNSITEGIEKFVRTKEDGIFENELYLPVRYLARLKDHTENLKIQFDKEASVSRNGYKQNLETKATGKHVDLDKNRNDNGIIVYDIHSEAMSIDVTVGSGIKQNNTTNVSLITPENAHQNLTDSLKLYGHRKTVYEKYFQPNRKQILVNCSAIVFGDDRTEIAKAKNVMQFMSPLRTSIQKYIRTLDCNQYKEGRGYILHPLSDSERNFPLAFSLLVYRDPEQFERLLRAIYRPHNYYCVHVDLKTEQIEKKTLETIVNCFDNVFVTKTSVNVTWGKFSVLEAELICMERLLQYGKWKYFINLTGQEFPLKTNRELVAILEAFEGANIVDGTLIRAREKYFYRWTRAKTPPPHRIRPVKGSVHIAVNRHFVNFSLNDPRSKDFLVWLQKTEIPDETFFSSLNHNPHLGINGSFLGEAEEYAQKPSLTRYKNWQHGHATFSRPCAGKFVRNICVLGVGDLHRAYTDVGLFANKFHLDFEHLALDCLEEVLYDKTWKQYIQNENIDTSYYSQLDYNKKKLFVPG